MARKKRKLSEQQYLNAAHKLAEFAPVLTKYKRRKKLNRWEKASIRRKMNIIGDPNRVFRLTKKQAKALDDKDAIIGNGVRAVRLSQVDSATKVRVRGGKLQAIDKARRVIQYIPTASTVEAIAQAAEDVFDRADTRNKRATVWLWLATGRAAGGFRSLRLFLEKLAEKWVHYSIDEERFRGIAALVE